MSCDARIFTKIRFLRETERAPAVAIRFGTKLPNASRDSRLGTDETDFGADALGSKDFGPLAAHVNLGILILGNPGAMIGQAFPGGGQDDLFTYNVAVASRPLWTRRNDSVRLLGEVTGFAGSHFHNDRSALRTGLQITRGAGTFYLGLSAGLMTASENIGVNAGVVYTFDPTAWWRRE